MLFRSPYNSLINSSLTSLLAYIHANNEVSDELINELYGAYKIVDFFVEKPILIDEILV